MQYNLGSGKLRIEGWLNVDVSDKCKPDIVADITKIPWDWMKDATAIRMDNVLEHLYPKDMIAVLNECNRKLEVGGKVWIRVPYLSEKPDNIYRAFTDPTHVNTFTEGTFDYWENAKNVSGLNRWRQFGEDYGIIPWKRVRQEVWNKTFLIIELVKI